MSPIIKPKVNWLFTKKNRKNKIDKKSLNTKEKSNNKAKVKLSEGGWK